MPNLLTTLPIEPEWQAIVEENLSEIATIRHLADAGETERRRLLVESDVLFSWNPHRELSSEELEIAGAADFMQLLSAGYDHLDFDALPDDLAIAANVGAYSKPIAEHVLGMAITLARRMCVEHENMRKGEFNQRRVNKSLRGANLGIVGFGGIGQEITDLFRPLEVDVLAINTSGRTDEDVAWCGTLAQLEHVLRESDLLVLCLPLTEQTRGLIGREELREMKDDAILVNVSRGQLIDQRALYEHLESNPNFRAGLEAWWVEPFRHGEFRVDYPLLELPNVLGCPHNSAVVPGALENGVRRAAENIEGYLTGGEIRGLIQ